MTEWKLQFSDWKSWITLKEIALVAAETVPGIWQSLSQNIDSLPKWNGHIFSPYFCSLKCCSEIKNFWFAAKFTFSANIICYNDPNFLCWHNLLTEILHFELHKTPRLWSPMAENWPLFSFLWQFMNCDLKIQPLMKCVLTKSFDFVQCFPAFSHELYTPCPIVVLMSLKCAM